MVSPTRSRLSSETADEVVAASCASRGSRSRSGRSPAPRAGGTGCGRRATPPAVADGNVRRRRPASAARAQLAPEAAARSTTRAGSTGPCRRRSRAGPSGRPRPRGGAPRPCCRAAPSPRTRRRPAPRGLSSPSKKTNRSVGPDRPRLDLAREPERDGRAGRAVVRADEAGDVLGVVVRADEHDAVRVLRRAPCRPRCAGRPGTRW